MLGIGSGSTKAGGQDLQANETRSSGTYERSGTTEGTIIGEHIFIEGTIRAEEDIIIDGTLKGSIEAKSNKLTVGQKGKVEADVNVDSIVISGIMSGNIIAKNKVQVNKNADFSGQIKTKRIAVEDGAYLKASIELEKEAVEPAARIIQGSSATASTAATTDFKQAKPNPPRSQAA